MNRNEVLELIKLSLWNTGSPKVDRSVYEEMKRHAISSLPAMALKSVVLSDELRREWETTIIRSVSFYVRYVRIQSNLPLDVPYVVLKGTSAAKYYPNPEYRIMGDIDIMPCRENYIQACEKMIENSWVETTSMSDHKRGRHRTFEKNGFIVEIHAFFGSMNDPVRVKTFDDYIVNNITDNHILPDLINGLVLIEHINQHLEKGLGLRQIIDWMMFVEKCLPDEKWFEFEIMAQKTGLRTLAITVTRMCELYLGLCSHEWSADADEKLCHYLMDYVLACGNFGNTVYQTEANAIKRADRLRQPFLMIKDLQERGEKEWELARNPILRPFSWMWQGIQLYKDTPHIMKNYIKSKKQNEMLDALGVKRSEKGLVYYENGEYVIR